MEKRREDRYPDVDAVLADLRRGVQGLAPPTPREQAVALYLEARAEGELDDEVLERLDSALAHAAKQVGDMGLEVRVDGAGCLLAVAPLREDPDEARARVLEAALALVEGREGLAAIVHVGALTRELLRLPGWVATSPGGGLMATEAALRGMAAHFHLEPVPDAPGRRRVTRKATTPAPP
jgi:serine/threonine-protein kinase